MEMREDHKRPQPRQPRIKDEIPVRERRIFASPLNIPEERNPDEAESKFEQLNSMFEYVDNISLF